MGEAIDPARSSRLHQRLKTWSDELMSLDRRNRLLYFKHVRTSSLEIDAAPKTILTALRQAREGVRFVEGIAIDDEPLPVSGANTFVVINKTAPDLVPALRGLDARSRSTFVERGVWSLYLGLGMLEWFDSDGKGAQSPLLLVPVALDRRGSTSSYVLRRTDVDAVVNPALIYQLGSSHDVRLTDAADPDLDEVLAEAADIAADRPGWRVTSRSVLAIFSFHKEAMYRDLRDHAETIAAHPTVQLLALGPDAPSAGQFDFEPYDLAELDDIAPPERLPTILDADGTQRRCLLHARDGRSFVMDGPPGTGKSQTIANIIATLIAEGKSVLFVSEKIAALEVVRNRLADAQLDDFLLELHSHKATRKEVAGRLGSALNSRPYTRNAVSDQQRLAAESHRRKLTAYARALNTRRDAMGFSLHDAFDQLATLADLRGYAVDDESMWADLQYERFGQLAQLGDQLSRAWSPIDQADGWLWSQVLAENITPSDVVAHRDLVVAALADRGRLADFVAMVDDDLGWQQGLDADAIELRIQILDMLDERPDVPVAWLSESDIEPIRSRVARLEEATARYVVGANDLAAVVGSDWQLVDGSRRAGVDAHMTSLWEAQPSWTPMARSSAELLHARDVLSGSADRIAALADDARRISTAFGMEPAGLSLARGAQLAELGRLSGAPARPEPEWFNPVVHEALAESSRVLGEMVRHVKARQESLSTVFTADVLALDLPGLAQRFVEVHRGLRRWSGAARRDRKTLAAATVNGKADKRVISRLEEARDWQALESSLDQAERAHAGRLGAQYHRTDTDFTRVAQAIDVARLAVTLAGAQLDPRALARQLSEGGTPDPDVGVRAERLGRGHADITAAIGSVVGAAAVAHLEALPLDVAAAWCRDAAVEVDALAACLAHLEEVAGRTFDVPTARETFVAAEAVSAALADVHDDYEEHVVALGVGFNGLETDWPALRKQLEWAEELRAWMSGPVDPFVAERILATKLRSSEVAAARNAWNAAKRAVLELFVEDRRNELSTEFGDLGYVRDLLDQLAVTAEEQLPVWDSFRLAWRQLADAGLGRLLERAARSGLSRNRLGDAIAHAMLDAWTRQTTARIPELQPLGAPDRDALVAQFRETDQALVNNAHADVVNACSNARPSSLAGETAIISKQANLKSRHLSIRDLMERAGNAAKRLTPCFMMSPISVSQYLPASMTFDVVIFDEASQVLPSDAINCIYRGNQLIVAGDDKQLPPTAFFARQLEGEEDFDDDAGQFESVLGLCKGAGGLRSLPLLWHYRSRHESLIAFSNESFYDGELRTFPGADFAAPDLGVAGFHVPGVYRRGQSRDNAIEAEAVVDRVVHHKHAHPDLSIGVVTFSSEQAEAVRSALEMRAAAEPEITRMLADQDRLDGFFVKNLESVQGDERDIIVFSIGYGRDTDGQFTLNFGPLNKAGGWRRLNVAITRARRRVEIVTSIRPSEFGAEPANVSVRHLRDYLAYALDGVLPGASARSSRFRASGSSSGLASEIARVVGEWGFEVDQRVGMAGVTVDVAVRDPDLPGHYLLGVVTDGPDYVGTPVARDRDRLRAQVLESLGWRLVRAWTPSWVIDRSRSEASLRAALSGAPGKSVRAAALPVAVVEYHEVDFDRPPAWTRPYRRGRGDVIRHHDPAYIGSRPALRTYLEQVVKVESPVHLDVLAQRVRDDWGLARITPGLRNAVRDAVGSSSRLEVKYTTFVVDPDVPVTVRHLGEVDRREVKHVCPDEIDLAIVGVVREAGSAEPDEVLLGTRRVFGWDRSGSEIQTSVRRQIRGLLSRGLLDERDGRLSLALNNGT